MRTLYIKNNRIHPSCNQRETCSLECLLNIFKRKPEWECHIQSEMQEKENRPKISTLTIKDINKIRKTSS